MRARFRWSFGLTVLAVFAVTLVGVAPAQPTRKVAPGLELVPTEGFAVLTVNVAALHDSGVFQPIRDALGKGDKAFLTRIETDTGLTPDQVERITAFAPAASYSVIDPPLILVTTRKPFDKAKVLKAWKATTEPGANEALYGSTRLGGLIAPPGVGFGGVVVQAVPVPDVPVPVKPKVEKTEKEKPLDLNAPLYYLGDTGGVLVVIDDRTLAFLPNQGFGGGSVALVAGLLRKKTDGPLAEALAQADKHYIVAAVVGKHCRDTVTVIRNLRAAELMVPMFDNDGNPIPPKPKDPAEKIEDEFTPYDPLFQLDRAILTFNLGDKSALTVSAQFPTSDAATKAASVATEGLKTLVALLTEERKTADGPADQDFLPLFDFALGGIEKAVVKAEGKTLTITASADVTPALKTAMLSVPQKLQETADRIRTQNNLRQIGIAIHSYHDTHGHLPRDLTDGDGKVLHSWRVQLLPYLEGNDLFEKIDKTKTWDDAANKKFWDQMPDVFKVAGRDTKEKGHTYFQAFRAVNWVGNDDVWMVDNKNVTLTDVTDGTSQTVAVLELEASVNWMQPGDQLYDPKKLPKIGNPKTGKANAAMLDGSVMTLDCKKYAGNKLTAILTVNGGEEVDLSGR